MMKFESRFAEGENWVSHSQQMRARLDVPQLPFRPYTDDASKALHGVSASGRVREVIDICWGSSSLEDRSAGLFADLSQCVRRKPWGTRNKTLTTGSSIFDFSRGQLVLPADILALQGVDIGTFDFCGMPGGKIVELAAESYFEANVGALLTGVFLWPGAPWYHDADGKTGG